MRVKPRFIPACAGNSWPRGWPRVGRSVHPRVCGELSWQAGVGWGESGSSPRVRGTRGAAPSGQGGRRFIPACAGNSFRQRVVPIWAHGSSPRVRGTRPRGWQGSRGAPVHPRVCGELAPRASAGLPAAGSSPRVRGTRGRCRGKLDVRPGSSPRVRGTPKPASRTWPRTRFIPACAGNSEGNAQAGTPLPGSSPRVRGTQRRRWASSVRFRFIPACAGNSAVGKATRILFAGSSPRVRGTHSVAKSPPTCARFIPACAGNSAALALASKRGTVHPRVCGELAPAGGAFAEVDGSSPRVRGTPKAPNAARGEQPVHPRVCGELQSAGVDAAPAHGSSPRVRGTRRVGDCGSCVYPVHPRVCGELRRAPRVAGGLPGSSPRVRGTPGGAGEALASQRFIPACAGNSPSPQSARGQSPVHPRVCGELATAPASDSTMGGSSPRVRGTLSAPLRAVRRSRFIPACAGNSATGGVQPSANPVHPRVCGELDHGGGQSLGQPGSSPRVRGTRPMEYRQRPSCRFIPACAGNSLLPRVRIPFPTVHPRVCGELGSRAADSGCCGGSSPRVRGTRARFRTRTPNGRFIPACAGNSAMVASDGIIPPVHPRVCGELYQQRCAQSRTVGSSPRVRGTRDGRDLGQLPGRFIPACAGNSPPATVYEARALRFIPACAGNSRSAPSPPTAPPVHPRVCGELWSPPDATNVASGSSPRVRGTRVPASGNRAVARFIPACAGNSPWSGAGGDHHSVHPRVCGELCRSAAASAPSVGSSPRVRGTPPASSIEARRCRFIPACAGNSPGVRPLRGRARGSSPRVRGTRRHDPRRGRDERFIPACAGNSGDNGRDDLRCAGSSPRVRGTLSRHRRRRRARRFIPACAGNSRRARGTRLGFSVHPRVCGELSASRSSASSSSGSSPRVRGTLTG